MTWLGWATAINIGCIVFLQIEIFIILKIMENWGE